MTEEKKDFSAAESGSAPGGAFCVSPCGKADTGGGASVGYGAQDTGNEADRASDSPGGVIGRGSDGETRSKVGEVMPDALKKESEEAASGGEVPPSDGQKSGAFYSAEEYRARAVNGRRRRRRRSPGKPQSVRRSLPRRSRRSARGFAPSLKGSANEAGSANGSLR